MILAVDYATLKALKPSDFENAADGYRKASSMASQAKDDLYNQIIPGMQKSLRGKLWTPLSGSSVIYPRTSSTRRSSAA